MTSSLLNDLKVGDFVHIRTPKGVIPRDYVVPRKIYRARIRASDLSTTGLFVDIVFLNYEIKSVRLPPQGSIHTNGHPWELVSELEYILQQLILDDPKAETLAENFLSKQEIK